MTDGISHSPIKDQKIKVGRTTPETTEEFLARGGKIEEVPVRSGEEITEYIKEQNMKRSKQALGTSRKLKADK